MAKKGKKSDKSKTKPTEGDAGLWVAPRYSLKGPAGERAWENRVGGAPSNSRFLELADIAMGADQARTTQETIHSRHA